MDNKNAPIVLIVGDNGNESDNSCVCLSPTKMEELQLFRGDTVILQGQTGRETLAAVMSTENTDDGVIKMNQVTKSNCMTCCWYPNLV
jgi:transitional endoplasmic reticulum ATPase